MGRNVLATIAALAVWVAIVSVLGRVLQVSWPEYARVAEAMTFTLAMQMARLAIGAVATVAAGWTAALITRSALARLAPGVLLLIGFIPVHLSLWDKFPVWYHLTFLLSLVPLTLAGARMANREQGRAGARAAR
jgi:hypothetical protein